MVNSGEAFVGPFVLRCSNFVEVSMESSVARSVKYLVDVVTEASVVVSDSAVVSIVAKVWVVAVGSMVAPEVISSVTPVVTSAVDNIVDVILADTKV